MYEVCLRHHQYQSAIDKIREIHYVLTGEKLQSVHDIPSNAPEIMIEGYLVLSEYLLQRRAWVLGNGNDSVGFDAAKEKRDQFYEKWYPHGRY